MTHSPIPIPSGLKGERPPLGRLVARRRYANTQLFKNADLGQKSEHKWNRDSGQNTCQIEVSKKMRCHLHGNQEIIFVQIVGVWGHTDCWLKVQICKMLQPNSNTQRMSLLSYLLRTPWHNLEKNSVALFLLNRYWGIVTVPGSFLKAGDLGWPDPHPPP